MFEVSMLDKVSYARDTLDHVLRILWKASGRLYNHILNNLIYNDNVI